MIELDNGRIGPAWTLEVAIEVAREAETAGRIALRIWQGQNVVMEGEALRQEMLS